MSTDTLAQPVTTVPASQRAYRLTSVDMLRGLVIVLMAIDHVRDFFSIGSLQDPTADPNVTAAETSCSAFAKPSWAIAALSDL